MTSGQHVLTRLRPTRVPASPAQSFGGRFGKGAEPPSEQIVWVAILAFRK
jgi:hypothetical protein